MIAVDTAASARDKDASIPGVEFGRFELLERLGEGGMGVVFRARDSKLGREVALKLLNLPGERAEAAVLHEAQCMAKLSHPNVVALHDTGKVGAELFLTMELVRGMDGRTMLTAYRHTWQGTIEIFLKAGRGLAAAHAAGLEHGDFKPENLLISPDRRVRVADFGVARVLRDQIDTSDDDAPNREDSGGYGSLEYMAPERLKGRRGDARSDQFSYCVAVWECLYGGRPFAGETEAALLEAMATEKLGTPVAYRTVVPRRLRKVIARGLSMKPADRWPDMEDLLDQLERIRQSGGQRQRRLRVAAVALGLAVGSSLATAAMIKWRVPEQPLPARRPSPSGGAPSPATADQNPIDDDPAANVVPEVIALLEADDLDGAHKRWTEARVSPLRTRAPLANEPLEIAHAFLNQALMLEHVDPDRAGLAAWFAHSVGSYAKVNTDPAHQQDLDNLMAECVRLTSHVALLLGEFTRVSDAGVTLSCACSGHRGYNSADDCHRAHGVGPTHHACLTAVIQGNEDAVRAHLECVVPAMETHNACVGATGCNPTALDDCRSSRDRDESTCPPLPKNVQRAFATCTR